MYSPAKPGWTETSWKLSKKPPNPLKSPNIRVVLVVWSTAQRQGPSVDPNHPNQTSLGTSRHAPLKLVGRSLTGSRGKSKSLWTFSRPKTFILALPGLKLEKQFFEFLVTPGVTENPRDPLWPPVLQLVLKIYHHLIILGTFEGFPVNIGQFGDN